MARTLQQTSISRRVCVATGVLLCTQPAWAQSGDLAEGVRIAVWDGLEAPDTPGPFVFLLDEGGSFFTPFRDIGINDDGLVWFRGYAKRPMGRTEQAAYAFGAGYGLTKIASPEDTVEGPDGPLTLGSEPGFGAFIIVSPYPQPFDELGPVRIGSILDTPYPVGDTMTSTRVVMAAGPARATRVVARDRLQPNDDDIVISYTTNYKVVSSPNGDHHTLVYIGNFFNISDSAWILELDSVGPDGVVPGDLIVRGSVNPVPSANPSLIPGENRIRYVEQEVVIGDDGTLVFAGEWTNKFGTALGAGTGLWKKQPGQAYELVLFNANMTFGDGNPSFGLPQQSDIDIRQPVGIGDDGRVFFDGTDTSGTESISGVFAVDDAGVVEPVFVTGQQAPGFPAGFTVASVFELRSNDEQPFEDGAVRLRTEVLRPTGGAVNTDFLLGTDGSAEPAVPFDEPVTIPGRADGPGGGPYTLIGGSRIGPVIEGVMTARSTYTNADGSDTGELIARSDENGAFSSLLATGDIITLPTDSGTEDVTIVRIDGGNFLSSFGRDRFNRDGRSVWNVDATNNRFALVTIDPPSSGCLADLNNNGVTDPGDFTAWIAAYNAGDPAADQNGNGDIEPGDFTAWVANYNAGC